jgi:hypothetical protein
VLLAGRQTTRPIVSDAIKTKKDLINNGQSHANVISADSVFRIDDTGELINAPFFDIEDDYFVKTALWLAASVALELMDGSTASTTGGTR